MSENVLLSEYSGTFLEPMFFSFLIQDSWDTSEEYGRTQWSVYSPIYAEECANNMLPGKQRCQLNTLCCETVTLPVVLDENMSSTLYT